MTLITTFSALGLTLFLVFLVANPLVTSPAMAQHADPVDVGTVIHTTTAGKDGNVAVDIELDFFAGGVMRLRARPTTGNPFQVTDVVVGKPLKPGPRKADVDPEEKIDKAPPGTYVCGGASDPRVAQLCLATSPCGTTSMRIGIVRPAEADVNNLPPTVEFVFAHKAHGVLAQGKVQPRSNGPDGQVEFPSAAALYGLPQRAVDLALKDKGSYRLYNLDVFKYQLDSQSGIYGSIPFLVGHSGSESKATAAVLWLNGGDTTVGTEQRGAHEGGGWTSKWTSEYGLPDIFFFPGPTAHAVQKQHAAVVGPSLMPPMFALGYHQCRWNYRSEEDSLEVDHGFETHDIPYDVLWLDIEHTDGKRYFTWDKHNFPNPKRMIDAVAAKGRKMVTITDPHIKVDSGYHVYKEGKAKRFFVRTDNGDSDFEGHCWPGTSVWIDFFNSEARKWYATLFHYDRYEGSTPDLYSWIDMGDPSVFNAHEVTMPKNNVHVSAAGTHVPHGALHNMYGHYHAMAAYGGHLSRNAGQASLKRPFVLTRSFFSGSQRYAAMWTGDNMARWDHLEKSLPMLLTLSLSNYIFVGADVGGFFDNPDAQLMTRWYQAAVFYPFFRGHAHLETKRREPWLFGEEHTKRIRDAIVLRYTLLPYYYTQFFAAHDEGEMVMRPLYYHFPDQLGEQRAFMVGPALLACPVTSENAETHTVVLPAASNWFELQTGKKAVAGTIPVTMDTVPAYVRGGHIIPTRQRTRRSTAGMANDPVTLIVAVDSTDGFISKGSFYYDDGDTFDFEKGQFFVQEFAFDPSTRQLTGHNRDKSAGSGTAAAPEFAAKNKHLVVEKVVIMGLDKAAEVKKAVVSRGGAQDSEIEYEAATGVLTIRRPQLPLTESWSLALE